MKEVRLVQRRETESIASDGRSKPVLLIPSPFENVFQMSVAGNGGALCQNRCSKMHKYHPGSPATLPVWTLWSREPPVIGKSDNHAGQTAPGHSSLSSQ